MEVCCDMKTIVDVFDPHNASHLSAWRFMENTGCWPKWFIEEECSNAKIPPLWQVLITQKMAKAWLDQELQKEK